MNTSSNQIAPGMTLSLDGKIYRVEFSVRVTVTKGVPFIKTKLKDLVSEKIVEKNFKIDQPIDEVALSERSLEYLYPERKEHLFLDTGELKEVPVSVAIIGDKVLYLKEGVEVKAIFYGETVFSIELPRFLELMVVKSEDPASKVSVANANRTAVLETGARVTVPPFIEVGDIIKVDTHAGEYVQRI
ncbi:MAG: elongation factor P [Simkaniaceae bacterium]|nr:elongation factor P [Simkaniaceae bacterium]